MKCLSITGKDKSGFDGVFGIRNHDKTQNKIMIDKLRL